MKISKKQLLMTDKICDICDTEMIHIFYEALFFK